MSWTLDSVWYGALTQSTAARHYVELMGFGHWDEADQIVKIDDPVAQGWINAVSDCNSNINRASLTIHSATICQEPSWDAFLEAGSVTNTDELPPSGTHASGALLRPPCRAPR